MFSGRLWNLFIDSFPKMFMQGLTVTIPLTVISFSLAMVIAIVVALVQFANIKALKQIPQPTTKHKTPSFLNKRIKATRQPAGRRVKNFKNLLLR